MKWITDGAFRGLAPLNVFHREREPGVGNDTERQNSHILFRKHITLDGLPEKAEMTVTADDFYRLFINGTFVNEGPAPSYHDEYGYDVLDVTRYLVPGENVIAVHTYYQGLINRVWQSGDRRHGLCLRLVCDGKTVAESDESFLCRRHSGFTATGKAGYDTQFLQRYDSRAAEVGFERPDYDDSGWEHALVNPSDDHTLIKKRERMLAFEHITPERITYRENTVTVDLGGVYVGYLTVSAKGEPGEVVHIRCGQELDADGNVRYALRAGCVYDEEWILSGGDDKLYQLDYKSFRYVSITPEGGAKLTGIGLIARHRPFTLASSLRAEYADDPDIKKVFDLCVRSQRYGVQELPMDCMEREKGTYLGDGCYTSLCNYILTGSDAVLRRFVNDAFSGAKITPTLVTCLNCSLMQEIAEYPLIMIQLLLWHYRISKDIGFLRINRDRALTLIKAYGKYEKDGILGDTGQWCVTEWPANYRDGYAVNNDGNKPLPEPHVVINAYYINAIRAVNEMCRLTGEPEYRDEKPLLRAFIDAFYDREKHVFKDGLTNGHVSFIGNVFPFGFGLCDDPEFTKTVLRMFAEKGVTGTSLFATFPLLTGFVRAGRYDLIKEALKDKNAWLRMIEEGATATFECWSKDGKWNTSLFHLQNTHAAVFMADTDLSVLPV